MTCKYGTHTLAYLAWHLWQCKENTIHVRCGWFRRTMEERSTFMTSVRTHSLPHLLDQHQSQTPLTLAKFAPMATGTALTAGRTSTPLLQLSVRPVLYWQHQEPGLQSPGYLRQPATMLATFGCHIMISTEQDSLLGVLDVSFCLLISDYQVLYIQPFNVH